MNQIIYIPVPQKSLNSPDGYLGVSRDEITAFMNTLNEERKTFVTPTERVLHSMDLMVMKENGTIVALCGVTRLWKMPLFYIVVSSSYNGIGFGGRLGLEGLLRARGLYPYLGAIVLKGNRQPIRLARRFGFLPCLSSRKCNFLFLPLSWWSYLVYPIHAVFFSSGYWVYCLSQKKPMKLLFFKNRFMKVERNTATQADRPKKFSNLVQLLSFHWDPIGFLTKKARRDGDIVPFTLLSQPVVFLNNPDYFKQVLVVDHRNFVKARGMERAKGLLGEGLLTSEGDYHHRQRRLIQPAFHRQRLAEYGTVMIEYSLRMRERWQDKDTIDIGQEMMRLTLEIVAKTLLGADIKSDVDDIGKALEVSIKHFFQARPPFTSVLERCFPAFFPSSTDKFKTARKRLDEIIYRIISEHRATGEDRGDLLSMLMLAEDEEGDGGGMTDVQLRDEAITIILAGHETTTIALLWTWYLLSQYPDVEARLHDELWTVLKDRPPTVEDLPQLVYTEMIVAEVFRLYPSVWLLGRGALQAYTLENVILPKNGIMLMSPYIIQRDPRYYSDPDTFDPQRWAPNVRTTRPKYPLFTFAAGPRQCIGEGFAWMEGVLIIATLAQRWRMRLVSGNPVKLKPILTLRPKHPIRLALEERV